MGVKLGTGNASHNHGSGLGGQQVWVYMEEVKKEFAGYANAHAHYVASPVKDGWPANHHSIVSNGQMLANWGQDWGPGFEKDALDFEEAKPFIRAVIERMLDLIDSEESWVKGQAHTVEDGKEKWCLIGAMGQAQADLGLQPKVDVDSTRRGVMAAINNYLNAQVAQETDGRHTSMPSFNDANETSYEDVRLWLKTALHKLDD